MVKTAICGWSARGSNRHITKTLLVMKLTMLLLTVGFFNVHATGVSQNVSFSGEKVSLETVFSSVKKQTGFVFVYSNSILESSRPVSLSVRDISIEKFLQKLFTSQPLLKYKIEGRNVLVSLQSSSPQPSSGMFDVLKDTLIDVKGRVINETGEPVPGVTVTVKETSKNTFTDANGEFSLTTIDQNATLVFTHVSMETFVLKVRGKAELAISLRTKVAALGNVQVVANTGYQQVKPNEIAGSVVVIDNKRLNEQTSPNILKRLEGITPGLLFDNNRVRGIAGNPKNDAITIRGTSTINASMEPLIVLDGFIYEGSIDNINPNDVENITILKDAAATSIWGARAGNGVIVITTKKGQFNQKLQVGFNTSVIVSEKPDLHYLPQMSSSDYIDVEQFLFKNGYFEPNINMQWSALTPAVEIFANRRNGLISSSDSAQQIDALKAVDSRDQYLKYLYTKPVTQRYSVNLRGGNSNNAYTFTIGYDKSLGELRNKFDKLNIKVQNIYKPVKNLLVDLSLYYTNSKSTSGFQGFGTTTIGGRQVPYYSIADENGNAVPVATVYKSHFTDSIGSGKLLDWKYYPLSDWKHDRNITKLQEIFANVGVQYNVTKFLNVDLKYQYQKQQSEGEQLSDLESYYARNLINSFSQIDPSTGAVTYILPKGSIRTLQNSSTESYTIRGQLNFNQSWNDHNVSAIVGAETREIKLDGNAFTGYGYTEDPLTYSSVDFKNNYPNLITGNSEAIPGAPAYAKTIYHYISLYSNASYTYKQRYILSASARRDGSNIFGANTNDKWKPLWSIGTAWNISNESFYKSSIFPSVKLRVTYGYNGNVDPSRSALPVGTYSGNARYTNYPFVRIRVLNNPDLRWEKTGMLNVGIDFSLKKNIISGSIDYYNKKGTDLYGPSLYDYTTWGYSDIVTINSADLEGKGIDLVINSKNIDKEFKWYSSFLFNYNTNKLIKYYGAEANLLTSKIGSGNGIAPVIGKPLYAIAALVWGGLDANGNPQGYVNGQLSTDYVAIENEATTKGSGNLKYFGPSTPPLFGSLINSFSWKNFTLSGLISYKFGYYFRKSVLSYDQLVNFGIGNSDYSKRWQKPGDESITNVPSFKYPIDSYRDGFYSRSAVNVLKADHIRLQYINLSYTLSQDRIKVIPFKEIQVYINAANLGIIWRSNNQNLDPEYPISVPPVKAWTFGLRANF